MTSNREILLIAGHCTPVRYITINLFICYFYLREIEVAAGGRGIHEKKRMARLRPLQEGTFWELQQYDRQVDSLKENVG